MAQLSDQLVYLSNKLQEIEIRQSQRSTRYL